MKYKNNFEKFIILLFVFKELDMLSTVPRMTKHYKFNLFYVTSSCTLQSFLLQFKIHNKYTYNNCMSFFFIKLWIEKRGKQKNII